MSKLTNLIGYCRNRGLQIHIRYPQRLTQIAVLKDDNLLIDGDLFVRQKDAALDMLHRLNNITDNPDVRIINSQNADDIYKLIKENKVDIK